MSIGSFLTLGFAVHQVYSSLTTSPVQIDLVFPRVGGNYLPVFPFPIVFALHNFSQIWEYRPSLTWRLRDDKTSLDAGLIGWYQEKLGRDWEHRNWGPPGDKVLAVNYTNEFSWDFQHQANLTLEYELQFWRTEAACRIFGDPTDEIKGSIHFTTNSENGTLPDLTRGGSCSQPLRSLQILKPNETRNGCPIFLQPPPQPIECAFRISEDYIKLVNETVTEKSNCSTSSKQEPGRKVNICPLDKSKSTNGSTILERSSWLGLLPIIFLIFALL
jgi:hypothetical protein